MSGPNEYKDYFIYTEQERLSQLLEQGVEVEEPEFYFMWNHIFREWFPLSRGWMVLQQRYVEVTPSFTVKVVLDASGGSVHDNILSRGVGSKVALVAVVRHALKWTDEGREHVMEELQTAMRAARSGDGVSIVWGIAAIGFHWKAFKQESLAKVDRVTEWRSDVLSPDSWQAMRDLVGTITQSV